MVFTRCLAGLIVVAACGHHDAPGSADHGAAAAEAPPVPVSAGQPTVEYRGEEIPVRREYADFDDYKNDPDNLPPASQRRAAYLVKTAPLPATYPDMDAMIQGAMQVEFPGYGVSFLGAGPKSEVHELSLISFEIPGTDDERIVVYRGDDGGYRRLDDFVQHHPPHVSNVELVRGALVYKTVKGEVAATHPLTPTGR